MNIWLGYNFCGDRNALDPYPVDDDTVVGVRAMNQKIDHLHASNDISAPFDVNIPIEWDFNTIMDCDFDHTINAGNITEIAEAISQIKIKRRTKGEFNWTTIKVVDIFKPEDLSFAFNDNFLANNETYEYAFVPIVGNVEGNYEIREVFNKFRGIYICDSEIAVQLYAGAVKGSTVTNQQIGLFAPFGRQYPVIMANGLTNYQTGSVSGYIVQDDYYETRQIDRKKITEKEKVIRAFLTNKKPKIIKDDEGNVWLVMITTAPTINYDNTNSGIRTISVNWTEIGDANNKEDLIRTGLIPAEE